MQSHPPAPRGAASAAGRGGAAPARATAPPAPLDCDFSFIYAVGELEAPGTAAARLPSEWAAKYGCGQRVREPDIIDERAGYDTATDQSRGPSWGRHARPGTAEVQT